MPRHNILYLIEHDNISDINKTDSRIVIIYDESNETYYCYGTRRREKNGGSKNHRYIDFQIAFPAYRIINLAQWLRLMNNNFCDRYTVEMHQIGLDEDNYDGLDFTQLKEYIKRYTEIFAYDKIEMTEESILEKLDILRGTVNP